MGAEPKKDRSMNDQPALVAKDVCASYGADTVVKSVSFSLRRGEILSLLGPSGCGKTTLLRSIAGLHTLDSGTLTIGGNVVADQAIDVPAQDRKIGMVFQDGALFPHMSVLKNVRFGLSGRPDASKRANEVLQLVGMSEYGSRLPGTLSGGQQQRVALARALAPEPEILLLDEPFSALDAGLRVHLRREIKQILADLGITVVVVTHDQEEAFILGDKVAVMREGELVQLDTPTSLYTRPSSAWVAGFVGEANLMEGNIVRKAGHTHVRCDLGLVPIPSSSSEADFADGSIVQLVLRPEQLTLSPGGDSSIISVEYFGHDIRYEVRLRDGSRIGVRTTTDGFTPGDKVMVSVKAGEATALAPAT